MASSLADLLASTTQMATALTANEAEVAPRGADAAFVAEGQARISAVQALEAEQEALKAALKLKTTALEAAQKALKDWEKEGRTVVKLAYKDQQEKWIEFGVKAKR